MMSKPCTVRVQDAPDGRLVDCIPLEEVVDVAMLQEGLNGSIKQTQSTFRVQLSRRAYVSILMSGKASRCSISCSIAPCCALFPRVLARNISCLRMLFIIF